MASVYSSATAVLATMHGKERVIAPAMETYLGLKVITPSDLDTDQLGTFTGEIRREGNMLAVAIRKARLGMQRSGLSLGIASEGSFGPHPVVPFLQAGMELMVLVDDARGLVISETLVTHETTLNEAVVACMSELDPILARMRFPTHGLVVEPNLTEGPWWKLHPELKAARKGIQTYDELASAVRPAAIRSEDRRARVTSDLRAHMNPTRMRSISVLAEKLARRIAAQCPACGAPGFGVVAPAAGLPCASCGEESIVPRGDLLGCLACAYRSEQPRLPQRAFAEPGECPQCNP